MDPALLVERPDFQSGELLAEQLKGRILAVDAAFWALEGDPPEWRLVLASPLVDELGSRAVYLMIQNALQSTGTTFTAQIGTSDLSLHYLSVVGQDDRLVRAIRVTTRGLSNVKRAHIRGSRLDGTYVQEAFVFWLFPDPVPGAHVLDHETVAIWRGDDDGRLFCFLGGPSEVASNPDLWFWSALAPPTPLARKSAKSLLSTVARGRATRRLRGRRGYEEIDDGSGRCFLIGKAPEPYSAAVFRLDDARRAGFEVSEDMAYDAMYVLAGFADKLVKHRT